MSDLSKEKYLETLQKVGSFASEDAANAFAQMLNQKISMSMMDTQIVSTKDINSNLGIGDHEMFCIFLKVLGEVAGYIIYICSSDEIYQINDLLTGKTAGASGQSKEYDKSALTEMINIMGGSYLNVLSRVTNLRMICSVPYIQEGNFETLLNQQIDGDEAFIADKDTMILKSRFIFSDYPIQGHFLFLPDKKSLSLITDIVKNKRI